jgi:hypothetical protein
VATEGTDSRAEPVLWSGPADRRVAISIGQSRSSVFPFHLHHPGKPLLFQFNRPPPSLKGPRNLHELIELLF